MSNISQYLADNSNAGACASAYYNNTHTPGGCPVQPGICSVIAFLVVELKNAEYKASLSPQLVPGPVPPNAVPVSPVPPVTTNGTGGGNLGNSSGLATWGSEGVEQRRS